MSALSIQPTFPIFTETNGLPLENGYIWIGAANLDPQGNPINVYWDAALTIPAAQPIRTLNGYPSRSGTPARMYVDSDYSIRVQNSKGSLVYSAPVATERYSDTVLTGLNAEDVTYDPPFTGGVQINVEEKLAQTVSLKDFGADPSASASVNTTAINAAFASGAERVVAEPGAIYAVNGRINIASTMEFDGQGCTFSATLPVGERLLQVTAAATIENLTLDFNDGYTSIAINFPTADVGYLALNNVTVQNIYDLDITTLTVVINVNADRNEVRFDGLTLRNIKKLSDGDLLDSGGIEGIYVFTGTSGAVGGGGYMRNLRLENIRTVNASGVDIEDICNAVYFAYATSVDYRARITVDGVYAYDFGRRLFKTQCSDLIIQNVYAEAQTQPAFVGIGIQDRDTDRVYNIKVKDAIIRGKIRYGIAVFADNVLLDGVDINVSLTGTGAYGNTALGIGISADNLTISNSHISAQVGLLNIRPIGNYAGLVKGLIVSNTSFKSRESGSQFFDLGVSTSFASIDSVIFNGITLDASDFPATSFIGNTTNLSNTVQFTGCTLIDNDATNNGGSGIYIDGVKSVNVTGFTHFNKNATSLVFRSFRFRTCTVVMLSSLILQAKPASASISTDTVSSMTVNGLYVDPSTPTSLLMTTTTSSRLSNLDRAKVNFNDTDSRIGCLFAPEFSAGTTAQRPTAGLLAGQQYWDTTLGKPIWWNGSVWKDAAGTTV
jgi:parallel beta-helix repeat protein